MNLNHFSVITVVRNDLAGLKRTRASLNKQKYKKWTHIIIDGGSTDGTLEYLSALPTKNTIFISEKDNGIYDAMNKGWKLAAPESYVYFLNARDLFAYPESLTSANLALDLAPETNWGCTTHEERFEDGSGWCCKLVSEPSIRNQLYAFGYRSHQGIVMRQSFLASLGGFDEDFHIAADWDLFVKAIKQEKPLEWEYPLAVFELGGLSSKKILDAHHELITLRRKYRVTTGRTRLFEELWRMMFLQYMGYSNPITKVYSRILRGRSKLRATIRSIPKQIMRLSFFIPNIHVVEFSFLGFMISVRRIKPKRARRPKRQRVHKRSSRRGLRVLAIERGLLIYLNERLQLEPYRRPRQPGANYLP